MMSQYQICKKIVKIKLEYIMPSNIFTLFHEHNNCIKMELKRLCFFIALIFCHVGYAQNTALQANVETPKEIVTAKSPSNEPAKAKSKFALENAEVKNVKVLNGMKDDFSPMFFENGILFCSNSKKIKKGEDPEKVPDDLNLKYALFDSLGNLTRPTSFGHRTNSKTHEGPSCFTKNNDTMFLTRNMSKGGVDRVSKNGKYTLKIYVKYRDTTGAYVGDKMLPFELENYSYCHPTLSKDGKRLYFSSDMPGGFGGMDLYMIRKMNDTLWTPPINLGARVNTAKNEVFPSISDNNLLYFASNGQRLGKGGLDIYSLEIENKTAIAQPLAEPFNTLEDDFGIMFLPNSNSKKGFFSSNRLGGSGGDDIYEFNIKE
jgi:hypothetical protein